MESRPTNISKVLLTASLNSDTNGTKIASTDRETQRIVSGIKEELASSKTRSRPLEELAYQKTAEDNRVRQRINQEKLRTTIEQLNESIEKMNIRLSFRFDEGSGRNVITVYDLQTGDILRQIPNDEMLDVVSRLRKQDGRYPTGLIDNKI
ncbi:flagellar protein FlaG [Vibrio sp.]|nr:flagellar protein FlaG [Vibrio sp.]